MSDFAGGWFTTFGRMDLEQSGTHVKGVYQTVEGIRSGIQGEVDADLMKVRYQEPDGSGTGSFKLNRHGKFSGQWREDRTAQHGFWHGHRGFDGVWNTSCGLLRLIQEANRIIGFYEVNDGSSTIEGELRRSATAATSTPAENRVDDRLEFRYREPKCQGEGWFGLDEDQWRFHGKWRPEGSSSWQPWEGQRVVPVPDLQWLVVLEAHWQRLLQQKDYALGGMLREFFARTPRVEVRHRFFASEADLETWCREILYLAEPVAVVVATHGSPEGIEGHGCIIGPEALVKSLRHADNVSVLHFSACYAEDGSTKGPSPALRQALPFPISGYAAYVDWAASALVDFTYLDMILEHYLPPEEAAEQVKRLIGFAGERTNRQCPYPPTRFRFWPAECKVALSAKPTGPVGLIDENGGETSTGGTSKDAAVPLQTSTNTDQRTTEGDEQDAADPSVGWSIIV